MTTTLILAMITICQAPAPALANDSSAAPADALALARRIEALRPRDVAAREKELLEYLLSRPEVDPKRLGMTGASGGGYNTWMTTALDDLITAAVPVVGTSDFAEQIQVCRPLDWYHAAEHCHFVPGLLRFANNHELLSMAAPRPLLIVAAEHDESFPVAGTRAVAEYGRELYHSYGAVERIRLVVDSSEGHGYQKTKREVRGVLVCVDDRGKEALAADPIVWRAFRLGWAVCGIDPRGIGESASSKKGWIFAVSLLLGENFVGRQAWDLRRAMEYLGAPGAFPRKPAAIYARGQATSLMATYAIALDRPGEPNRSRLRWYVLRDGFVSVRAWFERPASLARSYRLLAADRDRMTAYDREVPSEFFVFEGLRAGDLPRWMASSPASGLIISPIDGDWNALTEPQVRRLLPARIRVITHAEPDTAIGRFLDEVLTVPGP